MPRGVRLIKSWEREVLPKIQERLSFFKARGIKRPSLRAMFYALVSIGLIPNTKSYYVSLSSHTVTWRENGMLPIDCFLDETRRVVEIDDIYESPEEYVERLAGYLEDASTDYSNSIPRWHKQPNYVEVWTEKNAQIGILRSILRNDDIDRQVRIVPGGGYGSVSYISDNVERLKKWQRRGKKIRIRYFGDIDPSGEDIDIVILRKLAIYGIKDVDFRRVALTDDLIDVHELPRKPDPDTFEKLKNDPRAKSFKAKHNGELFQVEVDALVAKAPDQFKELVLNSVDEFFNEVIYEEVLNEYSENDVKRIVKKSIKSLLKRID